ncbi:Uncharacterized protein pbN1_16920 [Aromatoleum bremense]|nr:Uncharacterized protein pbN1_16920 [Aromatoleum bremense]
MARGMGGDPGAIRAGAGWLELSPVRDNCHFSLTTLRRFMCTCASCSRMPGTLVVAKRCRVAPRRPLEQLRVSGHHRR